MIRQVLGGGDKFAFRIDWLELHFFTEEPDALAAGRRQGRLVPLLDGLAEAPVGHLEMLLHHLRMGRVRGPLNEFLRFLDKVYRTLLQTPRPDRTP